MYFTSILRLPVFSPVINMTYNRAGTKRQQALAPGFVAKIFSYCDQMDHQN